jgi:hypothetical protein
MPRLMCMTRLTTRSQGGGSGGADAGLSAGQDLVTDVSSNFRAKERIRRFTPRPRISRWHPGELRSPMPTGCRSSANHRCCSQDVWVLRGHHLRSSSSDHDCSFTPRSWDTSTRRSGSHGDLKDSHGIGYCNITKCCTRSVENITITDNAVIPLKEGWWTSTTTRWKLVRLVRGKSEDEGRGGEGEGRQSCERTFHPEANLEGNTPALFRRRRISPDKPVVGGGGICRTSMEITE